MFFIFFWSLTPQNTFGHKNSKIKTFKNLKNNKKISLQITLKKLNKQFQFISTIKTQLEFSNIIYNTH